ncbi:MAG: PEP-CTERM sorting domain-containing protein [Rivularia sp. (in: cyanobacteria)]
MFNKAFLAKIGFVATVAGATLMPSVAQAANTEDLTLNWDVVDWQQITQNSSDFNRSVGVGEGTLDFQFTLDDGTKFKKFGDGGLTPDVNTVLNGSQADDDKSLHIQIDPNKKGNGVTMQTSFANFLGGSVSDVSFKLFDIDISGEKSWQDEVKVRGFLNGEVVNASFDVFNGNNVEVNGDTLTGIKNVKNNKDGGNVNVSFASAIDSFELFFADGDLTKKDNPSNHGIGIGDISFSANSGNSQSVPEPTALFGLITFGGFGLKSVRKRKQQ